jgi:hypothetical protein
LAHRSTVLPPMLYPLEWASHTVSQNIRILREYLKISRENSGEICKNFKELKTTHIFWTNPSFYFGRECLEILYKQDRISILKILK